MIFIFSVFIIVAILTVWGVKKELNHFNQFKLLVFINVIFMFVFIFFGRIPIQSYLLNYLAQVNILVIPVFLSTRFICNRFIFKNLKKNKNNSLKFNSTNPLKFTDSQLFYFISKIKVGEFPKASINKSCISGDYIIVKDSNGVFLCQIKISEIDRY